MTIMIDGLPIEQWATLMGMQRATSATGQKNTQFFVRTRFALLQIWPLTESSNWDTGPCACAENRATLNLSDNQWPWSFPRPQLMASFDRRLRNKLGRRSYWEGCTSHQRQWQQIILKSKIFSLPTLLMAKYSSTEAKHQLSRHFLMRREAENIPLKSSFQRLPILHAVRFLRT